MYSRTCQCFPFLHLRPLNLVLMAMTRFNLRLGVPTTLMWSWSSSRQWTRTWFDNLNIHNDVLYVPFSHGLSKMLISRLGWNIRLISDSSPRLLQTRRVLRNGCCSVAWHQIIHYKTGGTGSNLDTNIHWSWLRFYALWCSTRLASPIDRV